MNKSKVLIQPIDEHWIKECLENIFGEEEMFDVTQKMTNAMAGEFVEVPCEVIVCPVGTYNRLIEEHQKRTEQIEKENEALRKLNDFSKVEERVKNESSLNDQVGIEELEK